MNENNTLDGFTSEFLASLSQDSQDSMMRRVNAERLVRLYAENLIEQHQAESIRILPDQRLTGDTIADFLVQIDDYDFRLVMLDAQDGKLALNDQVLSTWVNLLEENPSTVMIIAVWTTDELLALPFTMVRLQALLNFPKEIEGTLRKAAPLDQVITEMIESQTKIWEIDDDLTRKSDAKGKEVLEIFSDQISQAIDREANRHYRNKERSEAARLYPYKPEKKRNSFHFTKSIRRQISKRITKTSDYLAS